MSQEYGPNERPALIVTEKGQKEITEPRLIHGYQLTSAGLREVRAAKKESVK